MIDLDPKSIFNDAVNNCKPLLKIMPVIRGGIRYTASLLSLFYMLVPESLQTYYTKKIC